MLRAMGSPGLKNFGPSKDNFIAKGDITLL